MAFGDTIDVTIPGIDGHPYTLSATDLASLPDAQWAEVGGPSAFIVGRIIKEGWWKGHYLIFASGTDNKVYFNVDRSAVWTQVKAGLVGA